MTQTEEYLSASRAAMASSRALNLAAAASFLLRSASSSSSSRWRLASFALSWACKFAEVHEKHTGYALSQSLQSQKSYMTTEQMCTYRSWQGGCLIGLAGMCCCYLSESERL